MLCHAVPCCAMLCHAVQAQAMEYNMSRGWENSGICSRIRWVAAACRLPPAVHQPCRVQDARSWAAWLQLPVAATAPWQAATHTWTSPRHDIPLVHHLSLPCVIALFLAPQVSGHASGHELDVHWLPHDLAGGFFSPAASLPACPACMPAMCAARGDDCPSCTAPGVTPAVAALANFQQFRRQHMHVGCAHPCMPLQAMLPFGLWEQDNWVLLMPFLFLSILMLGVDEVACQLENPWPLIPMRAYLKSTLQDTKR